MALLRLDDVSLAFGERPILDSINLSVNEGERVCLLGRNGEGKSTLLKVVFGRIEPDDGEVWIRPGYRVGLLRQDTDVDTDATVWDNVVAGIPEHAALLQDYQQCVSKLPAQPAADDIRSLTELEQKLDASGAWDARIRIDALIGKLNLPAEAKLASLSGGWRRRAMLARALISEPDLLLLDEPTNHLDIAAIAWLEQFMLDFRGALLFVSHDRMFSERLATRVLELDRGALASWPGTMADYKRRKQSALAAEARSNAEFDKKLAREEQWIRQGIKARRTRNEGRVRALQAMREQQKLRRESVKGTSMKLAGAELSGKIVVDCLEAAAGYGNKTVLQPFDARILRGDRIGIVGPNGSGKSTLLKLLLGELKPLSGHVYHGTRLEPAYFDQQRDTLNPERSVRDNVNDGSDYIEVSGRKTHVAGYLKRFLFPPERFDSPVSTLSGGERNRLLLAKMLARPTNFMILDEPTNDLDVETLELLEDMLCRFDATLVLVSHDRAFLDNVVTGIIHIATNGEVSEYVGNYSDFERVAGLGEVRAKERERTPKSDSRSAGAKPTKLSYREQQEYAALPGQIEKLETAIAELTKLSNSADFYANDHEVVSAQLAELTAKTEELDTAYTRWVELESRATTRR